MSTQRKESFSTQSIKTYGCLNTKQGGGVMLFYSSNW